MASRRKDAFSYLIMKRCDCCGREFIPAPFHVYKLNRKRQMWYCSYTCYLRGIENTATPRIYHHKGG